MRNADVVLNHHVLNEYGRMTLISWNGGPIFRNGAVGTEQGCCCGPRLPTGCNCGGGQIVLPSSVAITVDVVGPVGNTDPNCDPDDFAALLSGTYLLPFDSNFSGTTFAGYYLSLANNISVEFSWSCNGDLFGLGNITAELRIFRCDPDDICFRDIRNSVYFGPLFNPYRSIATLCELEQGVSDTYDTETINTNTGYDSDTNEFCTNQGTHYAFDTIYSVTPQW